MIVTLEIAVAMNEQTKAILYEKWNIKTGTMSLYWSIKQTQRKFTHFR